MISLQSHNQVLYHLAQLAPAVTPRSTLDIGQMKQQNNSKQKAQDIFCKGSFLKAKKSCNELYIEQLNLQSFSKQWRLHHIEKWDILEYINKKKHLDLLKKTNKWNMSYLSGASFAENKRDCPTIQSMNNSNAFNIPTMHLYIKAHHRFLKKFCLFSTTQVRYFKTDRSIKAEFDRNPTLSTRIQKWIGFNTHSNDKLHSLSRNFIITNTALRELQDIDKLRKVHNDKFIQVEELQRIKTAFAEGYLAGQDQKNGRAFRALRFTQQIITTILLVALLVGIMGAYKSTTGGSMFKIQLGSRIQVDPEEINVTFDDVKGVEEAKNELMDVVEFLKNPDKFSALGGKLPKGVLLVGPPGTGKTLLARAVAGEAGVPFFHAAGPEFDEVLVGQGARRVRDLFKAAKERAPCVIFIDEIDSVGSKRTNSALHPYANQTINQLLSEMDGFHQNEGVIVLGATNRREDLDKALLRPGRFDSEITVQAPDFFGRKEILDLYLAKILTRHVDAEFLAKYTIGFTGADIETMINQAALRAAIEGAGYVTMDHLERARDKILMGPEGKKKWFDEDENRITAYHEGGHALVTYFTKEAVPLHKVTIIPRGRIGGHTSYLPHKDVHYLTKAQMLASMDSCMGGRAAEELIFGQEKVTSGAYNDFMKATEIAEKMVKIYGMSEKVGFRVHVDFEKNSQSDYSTTTKELIDNEIKRLLQESYDRAKTILKHHSKEHKLLAEALLKYETLSAEDITNLLSGNKLRYETANDSNRAIMDSSNNVM